LDETAEPIELLAKKQRKVIVERTFGVDRDKIKPFSEEDRGEDSD
jgi:hypothetical protein